MPSAYTYPGVYVEEIPSGVRTITGVSTSNTAFIDFFRRGPLDEATRITSFGDFERLFGGLDQRSEASYAIQQYYLNGGSIAWIVRVAANGRIASAPLNGGSTGALTLTVEASSPGIWGERLRVAVDHVTQDPVGSFNLVVREVETVSGREQVVNSETFRNLSMNQNDSRYAPDVVNNASSLIRLTDESLGELPASTGADVIANPQPGEFLAFSGGDDGDEPGSVPWNTGAGGALIQGKEPDKTGIFALDTIAPEIFNLMCVPAAALLPADAARSVYAACTAYCRRQRAFLLIDIPAEQTQTPANMMQWMKDNDKLRDDYAAVYFPSLEIPDKLNEFRPRGVGASGTLAGVYARTDASRGVWKAPAGTTDGTLRGVTLTVKITDLENGGLNPFGINALRNFPVFGNVAWGARTLDGADQKASEWKYISIRRTALYIEESLYQGLKWVVFEPNDEPLWAQIRLNAGAFMNVLFRQGAFQGKTPREAYFVKCDKETTTQNDVDHGLVNILVGFAPLKPAEFVVIKLQQMAGQIQT